jgi:hypothetical protein
VRRVEYLVRRVQRGCEVSVTRLWFGGGLILRDGRSCVDCLLRHVCMPGADLGGKFDISTHPTIQLRVSHSAQVRTSASVDLQNALLPHPTASRDELPTKFKASPVPRGRLRMNNALDFPWSRDEASNKPVFSAVMVGYFPDPKRSCLGPFTKLNTSNIHAHSRSYAS